jgi:hypothetical protein
VRGARCAVRGGAVGARCVVRGEVVYASVVYLPFRYIVRSMPSIFYFLSSLPLCLSFPFPVNLASFISTSKSVLLNHPLTGVKGEFKH